MVWVNVTPPVAGTAVSTTGFGILVANNLAAIGGSWTNDARSAATIWSGTAGTGGSVSAQYRQVGVGSGAGGFVEWEVLITLGTGFSIGTGLTLPVTALSAGGVQASEGYVFDSSASSYSYVKVVPSTTTQCLLRTLSGAAFVTVSGTAPITFAAADTIFARIGYRI